MIFSIIVPVYNVEQYLPRCIESILNQSIKEFELILINDGSTDKSGSICDYYANKDDRIVVVHKENGGVSSARNYGLDIAKNEYIAFVDSDDYVYEDYLEKLYNPSVDIVLCNIKYDQNNNKDYYILNNNLCGVFYINGDIIDKIIDSRYFCCVYSKMFRRSIIKKYNIKFNENISLGEDTMFVVDYLINSHKLEVKDDVIYNYITYKNTLSSFKEDNLYYLEVCDNYIEKKLSEVYEIENSIPFKKRKWSKYEYIIFQTLRTHKMKYIQKRKLLNKVFKNRNYIELVKNIDIYMPNDTRIVRKVLATKNTNIVMIFFYICDNKELLFNRIKRGDN